MLEELGKGLWDCPMDCLQQAQAGEMRVEDGLH